VVRGKMVANATKFVVNQHIDELGQGARRGGTVFREEIEMDSLEPEVTNFFGRNGVLGTINENDFGGTSNRDELNDGKRCDVSFEMDVRDDR
jgi:hypothetical protein